jgi:hypothetical protein
VRRPVCSVNLGQVAGEGIGGDDGADLGLDNEVLAWFVAAVVECHEHVRAVPRDCAQAVQVAALYDPWPSR